MLPINGSERRKHVSVIDVYFRLAAGPKPTRASSHCWAAPSCPHSWP